MENYDNPYPNTTGVMTGSNNPPAQPTVGGQPKNLNYQKEKTASTYSVSKEIENQKQLYLIRHEGKYSLIGTMENEVF